VPSDDRVKVLDFGLAKAFDPLAPAGEEEWGEGAALSNSPTMSVLATGAGAILGTAAYMSPEQARGKAVDKRTDIWAFGCVLYEMLAGRPAFGGETASDTISLILQREPDWSALPAATPAMVRRLVGRCLEKDPKRRLRDIGDVRLEIDEALAEPAATISPPVIPAPRGSPRVIVWLLVGALSASTIVAVSRVWPRAQTSVRRDVASQRLTDFVGIEESPAISPDGKTVAFVAPAAGKRQIWIRLLAGGAPLQITNDGGDHQQPRWTPDSSTLIYYALPVTLGGDGTLWEISALGGSPRRLGSAVSGGDVSHDGRRVAVFQIQKGSIQLSAISRDGSLSERLHELSPDWGYSNPRWSPDDRVVAFQRSNTFDFDVRLSVAAANDVPVQDVAQGDDLRGASWLPDGSGFVYSSSRGSTVLYPPAFNLRMVGRDGTGDRQLTFGDVSYADPDLHSSGKLAASRIRSQSDIWKFPVTGSPADNTRGGARVTHQTGAVQTPSLSPDGTELVYLSDSGGHGNLWIAKTDGSGVRQITFERDPAQTIGVPVWSPAGNPIVFITTRNGVTGLSAINADGSGLRQVVPRGSWAAWSGDGRWLYYMAGREGPMTLEKIPVDGGRPVVVRSDNAGGPALTPDGSTLYFVSPLKPEISSWGDWEIRKASPENGAYQAVARVSSERVPISPLLMHMFLSPDSRWLAMPLTDGTTSNIWALPTDGGPMRPLTDFGSRPVVIARRVAWSPDGKFIYAAVAETDADVALLDGLLR
jgi:Tol biopolymer transport system component